jgi:hypothetical protein
VTTTNVALTNNERRVRRLALGEVGCPH